MLSENEGRKLEEGRKATKRENGSGEKEKVIRKEKENNEK